MALRNVFCGLHLPARGRAAGQAGNANTSGSTRQANASANAAAQGAPGPKRSAEAGRR
ncbi:MAG TPA: hypothetical protein VLA61_20550 [Ideonella sp.]|uniref:hypothetical protein n=1 Tax=Ideonella sp. TaxID=1929293 RepID=UPI002C5A584A|nr:hypothetical protein [Ideonella sp.]HSI50667.1 hypothetical protein [Ideonella sp.]